MVIQSSLILGIIEFRDVVGSIQTNSVENVEKATETRRARLESQMLQRWSRIYQREPDLTQTLEQFLEENRLTPEELNGSQTLQQEFLPLVPASGAEQRSHRLLPPDDRRKPGKTRQCQRLLRPGL